MRMLPRKDRLAQVDPTIAAHLYATAEHAREGLGWCLGHMAECIAAAETEIHRCRVTSQKIVEDARRLYGARAKGYYQEAAKALEAELASQTSMRDQLQQKTAHVRGLLNSSVSAILPSEKPGRYAGFTVPTGHKTQQAAIRGPSSHMAPAGMDALLDADVRRGRRTDGMTPSPTIGRTLR